MCTCVRAQSATSEADRPLTYYLPDLEYDPSIPTPESFLGYQIGDWHISHDLQQAYMRLLAASSDRIELMEIGRTYEHRPLLNLIFTSPENHGRLEELRQRHLNWNLADGGLSDGDLEEVPAVLYQGFSIHGNEPSGANAAPLVAYYLAAAPLSEVAFLENNIVVFDPAYNPDGMNRFASWVNSHKNKTLTADPNDREYNEAYPRGRSNHYWFDLNRDWLPVQHPESRARIAAFHRWKPNVLTDHHEMGKDATFFFMPGEPTRVHPSTPKINQELTARIGTYHAAALDEIGSLYYSGEGYDDFYYGKGSTYPDIHGTVGILFEQASSRGHLQETENGLLDFPFTVRNQVTTALSTLEAFGELRNELLTYQRDFNLDGVTQSGYVIDADGDPGRARELANILARHDLPVQRGTGGDGEAYYVPKTPFSEAAFEPILEFEDSLFYDVSTFSLPMAFNLPYSEVSGGVPGGRDWTDYDPAAALPAVDHAAATYAYLLPANDYYSAKAVYRLLAAGVRVKVSDQPFATGDGQNSFGRGTAMIPVVGQDMTVEELHTLITEIENETGLDFIPAGGGTVDAGGLMFGSRSAYQTLRTPEIALLVEGGTNSLDAGEIWHLLDQRFGIPITKLPIDEVAETDLSRYNTIVMPDGRYDNLHEDVATALQEWMGSDHVFITIERAGTWAAKNGLAEITTRKVENPDSSITQRPYEKAYRDRSGRVLGGSIYQATGDLTHPLLFGLQREEMPVFRTGTLLYEPAKNVYATPLRYTDAPLVSGYSPRSFADSAAGSAAIIVCGVNGGRTISFASNPNFRGFWYGGNRLFMNAIFFGSTISGAAAE
ncbi:hypothetical protein LEM8419_01009 [Neolewinella maritima]|uniref:Peptidase M14 domain-containing protein n=1 Tax=Neolewinella maritima TaxID=1383882 RepID=A0ABM9AZF3_9BACT|nr:M14 family zinc carboxypeptidase [Neolewinella maritima]CAH0999709.1 hypothetical protein LEM8419_01009 [Neolewinella maritima]